MDFGGIRINSLTMVQLPWIFTLLGWGVFLLTRPCLSRSDCAAADGQSDNDAYTCTLHRYVQVSESSIGKNAPENFIWSTCCFSTRKA